MLPVVVIAGRPNVGKSTLFNRLAGRRSAIVSDTPGVTRDRKDAEAMLRGRNVRLVDTAGLEESDPEAIYGRMRASSEAAVGQADLIVFVIDARVGITPADEHFANWLRRQNRPVLLVANKAEGRMGLANALEAYSLGLGDPLAISAEHNEGISDLMREIAEMLPPEPEEGEAAEGTRPLKLAIVGRPNAGKSTLLNRLVGEDRMITGPEPGLTRDAVSVILHDPDGDIELVDTAGLRKRARIEEALEKMSVSASIEALKMAEVVALTVDVEQVGCGGRSQQDPQGNQRPHRIQHAPDARFARGDIECGHRRRHGQIPAHHPRCRRRVEHPHCHGSFEPLVRAGAGAPSAAARGRAATEDALHHPGQGPPAHLPGVRHPRRADARGLPPLSGQQPARQFRPARHPHPHPGPRHHEPLCRPALIGR